MSLINDMLRDLEARKRADGQAAAAGDATPGGAAAVPHALDARTRGSHDSTDDHIRYRMRWLLPAYAVALIVFAVGLYLTFVGPQGVLQHDALSRAVAGGSNPAAMRPATLPVAATAAPEAAPAIANLPAPDPRLVMIGVDEAKGPALTLNLRFAPALAAPLRVDVIDGVVSLFAAKARAGNVDAPSPLLDGWQTEQSEDGWHVRFAWRGRADVSLQPVLGADTSQGWVIRLLPALATAAEVGSSPSPVPRAAQKPATSPTTSATAATSAAQAALPRAAAPTLAAANLRDADTLYADAWRLQQSGKLAEAVAQLERLIQNDPAHAQGRELLARLLARLGRADRAIQILREGLTAVPGQPAWVELLARLLDGNGQRQQAIDLLASQGLADNSSQQALLGALATQAGRYPDAAQAYRHLLALDGSQSRWWLGLAVALESQGDVIAARTAYQGALDAGHLEHKVEQFVRQRLAALSSGESQ